MDLPPARRSMSPSRLGLVALGIAATIVALYLIVGGRPAPAITDDSPRPSVSATPEVAATTIRGTLIPVLQSKLAVAVPGAVIELPAPVGTVVEVGQSLLRVDGTRLVEAVKVAEADVRRAKAGLGAAIARRSALTKKNTSGDRRVANAEVAVADAAYRSQQAALAAARAEAGLTDLKAPFPGTVMAVETQIGEQVGPGDAVITLADTSSWLVEVLVPEELAVQLAPSDAVKVAFGAIPRLVLSGKIRDVARGQSEIGSEVGYLVDVELSGGDPRLRPGLRADVDFATPR